MTMPAQDAWSYTPPTDNGSGTFVFVAAKDEVRFYLQDTDPTVRLLADTEINYLIGKWQPLYNNSLIYVAAIAADTIASKFAGVVRVDADGVAVDLTNLAPAYTALAKALRGLYEREQVDAEVDIANLMWTAVEDPSLAPLAIGVGDMDNPYAGLQDYGGQRAPWWTFFDGDFLWAT